MRGLDPRIHLIANKDGLHRTSGLPEVRTKACRKSGKPRLAVSSPAMMIAIQSERKPL
jgi:hypothetical protein